MTDYFLWVVVIPLVTFFGGGLVMTVFGAVITARSIDRDPTV